MTTLYHGIIRTGEVLQSILLLAIRLAVGYGFYQAGLGKLMNLEQTAGFFANLHIPMPTLNAYLVGTLELVGGALLVLGLGSRLAALILAIIMAVAYFTAHHEALNVILTNPALFLQEPPFLFLSSVLIIWAFGPGVLSLDALLKRWVFKGSEQ